MSLRSTLGAPIALLPPRKGALENRALLPAALHALIVAALARLFDRLEQLLLLWRSGVLAPHRPIIGATATRPESAKRQQSPQSSPRRQRNRTQSPMRHRAPIPARAQRRRIGFTGFSHLHRPISAIPAPAPRPPRRSARAPPALKPLTRPPWRHRTRTPQILRYHND